MPTHTTRITAATVGLALTALLAVGCSQTKEATKDAASSATSAASAASSAATSAEDAATSAIVGKTTYYYPDQQTAMFSIEAPDDWNPGMIEAVGDFGSLESKNGSLLQFRAQSFGTEDETMKEIDAIVDSTNEFLKDNYVDVQLDDPMDVTVDGQPGAQLAGIGKDKDGNEVKFLSAIIALGPTSIAEIWAAVFPEGSNDLDAASAVLDSFKVVKQ